ncbi:MAG TPA: GAF domain-containing sensor histidine kinase [Burkholderiales bacterium]|nr:GAF domain-containing sensor histidine kinase [Burkholderiales bacterium]
MDRAVSGLSQKLLDVLEELLRLPAGDLKATLSHAADLIARLSGADKVDAFLYDPGRDSLVAVGSSTQPLSQLQRQLGLDVLQISNGGRVVHVFKTGETYLNGRVDQDMQELPGIRDALKIRSKLGVPLVVGGECRGMIMVASLRHEFFSEEDARFMETVAPWIGLVAHRAELAAEIARNAAEQGRRAGAEELITVLAHDLRNYIAPINMRINVLRMRAEQERREDELRDIGLLARSVDRLGELISDILDVSRIEQGMFHIQPQLIEVSGLVREVVSTFESAQHAIKLTIQQGDNIVASGDPARLRQCLENVIANAIQKSPVTGAINIFVRRREAPPRTAVVEVIDEGPGIPADQIARLFEPFQTGRAEGLGLGLYLAKQIARIHGGDLTAASATGKGARFTLTLPAYVEKAP